MEENLTSRSRLPDSLDPVYVVDGSFVVRSMNPSAEALSMALAKPGALPDGVSRVLSEFASAPERRAIVEPLGREVVLSDPASGKPRTYVAQVLSVSGEPGDGWVVVLKDVTLREEESAARTKAMSTLGHEVRTPVSSIRMVLHLLLEEKVGPLTSDQRELVAAGHEDCERLLTILQGLLELARFESGRVTLKLEPISVEELLASSGFSSETLPSVLPRVIADSAHLVRALKLFRSVVLPAGTSENATVRVGTVAAGMIALVVRRGTKRALSATERDRIFEPFAVKVENDPEKSGVGLAIAREIVTAHGGRVAVRSDETGLEFCLELPVAGSAAA